MQIKYAWRVMRGGEPTSIVLTLGDEHDSESVAAVRVAAVKQGVELEPLQLDELDRMLDDALHGEAA